jgi:hypothetical protein
LITPQLEWPYIQSQRFAGWAYGLPKKVTVYDKDNKVVTETANVYTYLVSKVVNVENQNCKCATVNKRSYNSYGWDEYEKAWFTWGQEHWMVPRPYYVHTGRSDLSNTTQKSYANGSLFYHGTTSIITDPLTLLQKGTMVARDANSITIRLSYYPSDFNLPGALERLKQQNALHTPVSTETWLLTVRPGQSPGYTLDLLDASVTEYNTYTFGGRQEVRPWRSYRLKTRQPIPSGTIGMHNPLMLIRQPSYYKLEQEFAYDDDGNLAQVEKDGQKSAYINQYKGRHVVATVTGAAVQDIAYTSFEADEKGSWGFNALSIKKDNGGLTGSAAFKLGPDPYWGSTTTISRAGLDPAKSYTVTYWVSPAGGTVSVNGQPSTLLYTEVSGWKLYRNELNGTAQVTLTGDALLDELRLYPKGTLMASVAYKEGVGKMTECDANNRLLHYEYDALSRLKLVRDQNRNVIKTYEYNYKNQ